MIIKFKNITSLILLLVFLLPSIVKLDHHHDSFVCKAKKEKHYHVFHDKCSVCNFEFSVFSTEPENILLQKELPADKFCNNYRSVNYTNFSKYSFLLRAPPYKQI